MNTSFAPAADPTDDPPILVAYSRTVTAGGSNMGTALSRGCSGASGDPAPNTVQVRCDGESFDGAAGHVL
jgi:hypothetical protein